MKTESQLREAGPHHGNRSEEHTSELQSQSNLVCRLLLEKKKRDHRGSPERVVRGTVRTRLLLEDQAEGSRALPAYLRSPPGLPAGWPAGPRRRDQGEYEG